MSLWQTCSENIPMQGELIRFMLHNELVVREGCFIRYGDATYFEDVVTEAIYRPAEVFAWVSVGSEPETEPKRKAKAPEKCHDVKTDKAKSDETTNASGWFATSDKTPSLWPIRQGLGLDAESVLLEFKLSEDGSIHKGVYRRMSGKKYFLDTRTYRAHSEERVERWHYLDYEGLIVSRVGTNEIAKQPNDDNSNDAQEAKADAGKLDPTLVPSEFIWAAAAIRRYGTKKYGSPDNWKRVSVERYRSAAYRHWLRYLADPHGVDEESGYPHLWHWLCNAAFIAELEKDYLKKYYETNKEE